MSKTTILYSDIAPGAAEDAQMLSANCTSFSDLSQLTDGIEPKPTAVLERNYWLLDGKHRLRETQPAAYWSNSVSDENAELSANPGISIIFDEQYSSVGITLVFDRAQEEYAGEMTISWQRDDNTLSLMSFKPTDTVYLCQNQVEAWDRLNISFQKTLVPCRRIRLEQIIFGLHRTFTMNEIESASAVNEMNICALELPISSLKWNVNSRESIDFMFQLRQPVRVMNDDKLLGIYYVDQSTRTGKTTWSIDCNDCIGVLDETTFYGSAYLDGKSAKALLEEIIRDDFVIEYDKDVQDTVLYGVLAPSTKREAIKQVIFAWGVQVRTDGREGLYVFNLPTDEAEVPEKENYSGVSVDTDAIVTSVSLTAHKYERSDEGDVDINGKKYMDTKTVYTIDNPNVSVNTKQNIKEISDATLVSPEIGQQTAQRVFDYYARRNTNKAKILWTGQKLGDRLKIANEWSGSNTGNVERMELRISNKIAASCETLGV